MHFVFSQRMKIALNWLKQHVEYTGTPEKLAEMLTDCGLEVEGIEEVASVKGGLKGLVVGEVLLCEPIPETDHLNKTLVDIGNGIELPIVCGASNVAKGQKVVVAPPGVTIYPTEGEPFTIGKRKLRGVASEGMICAEDEIGLGTDHSGILVLKPETPVGTSVAEYFQIEHDALLDIGLTANRGDAASHRGVARDVAAMTHTKLKPVQTSYTESNSPADFTVSVEDEACGRYTCLLMNGIEVKESPAWLQNRLRSLGLKPINNIVDITNFVLHDIGQPIHAFDADKIKGKKIIVRKGLGGQKFITLDGVSRELHADDLMICDAEKPLAIAGVFGGADSGVSQQTQRILIESAYFQPTSIRKTAKRHGLSTDASFRYERGTDPNITQLAMERVATLVEELAGGKAASQYLDIYPQPIEFQPVFLERRYLDGLLGVQVPAPEVERILLALEIQITASGEEGWHLLVPPFKSDVTRPADVAEEIIRIYGLAAIPVPEKVSASFPKTPKPDHRVMRRKMAELLVSRGFYEMSSNSMTTPKYYSEEQVSGAVHILNPLSSDLEIMRPAMLPSLLQAVSYNKNRKNTDLKFFELGKVYFKTAEGKYIEEERLALVVTGNWTGESWHGAAKASDVYFLKQEVEMLLARMGMKCRASKWLLEDFVGFEKSKAWVQIGQVAPRLLKTFDISGAVYYAELSWSQLIQSVDLATRMPVKPAPRFPAVRRDLSLVLDQGKTYAELEKIIQATDKGLIKEVNVFDVYEGDKLPEGKKSYSLSFLIQDEEKTLSDKEIDALMNKLMLNFEQQVQAIIRK